VKVLVNEENCALASAYVTVSRMNNSVVPVGTATGPAAEPSVDVSVERSTDPGPDQSPVKISFVTVIPAVPAGTSEPKDISLNVATLPGAIETLYART
jgi:hypothetical protein